MIAQSAYDSECHCEELSHVHILARHFCAARPAVSAVNPSALRHALGQPSSRKETETYCADPSLLNIDLASVLAGADRRSCTSEVVMTKYAARASQADSS